MYADKYTYRNLVRYIQTNLQIDIQTAIEINIQTSILTEQKYAEKNTQPDIKADIRNLHEDRHTNKRIIQ